MRILSIFIIIIVCMSMYTVTAFAQSNGTGSKHVVNVAHRGASGHAPENTMAAFQKAFEMKADYIEIDVQLSKDGKMVIMHDTTLDRTTNGTGNVRDYTLEELKQLDAGRWFSEEYAGEHIPTFEEVIDTFRGKIGILIELKSPELYPGVEEKVADTLKERNMDKPKNNKIIIQSFNHESVQTSKELLPTIPHGVLAGLSWADVTDDELVDFASYADYFNPNMNILTPELVDRIHSTGMEIYPYTVITQEQADNLFQLGVDGIITNFPEYVYDHPVKNG
ncbi:glycerophosphodiester phosphodiesterase [Virgibacillus ndiopensis]|uniref:glycerophosphodiester phosphodiesterase n=1 Tax=Virgibacillus ndiopensis TaxID=2004408 RepID=UPI003CCBE9D3